MLIRFEDKIVFILIDFLVLRQNSFATLMRIGLDMVVSAWHEIKLQTWFHSFAKQVKNCQLVGSHQNLQDERESYVEVEDLQRCEKS